MNTTLTREEWLELAADKLVPFIEERAGITPGAYRLSVGFPKAGPGRSRTIGQCWHPRVAADQRAHIFVCPTLASPFEVVETLLHELLHAAAPDAGHRGAFITAAKAVGFKAPWTVTPSTPELAEILKQIVAGLPTYPHGALQVRTNDPEAVPPTPAPTPEKPGSRLRLWVCSCGVKVRVARDDFRATCDHCAQPFKRSV